MTELVSILKYTSVATARQFKVDNHPTLARLTDETRLSRHVWRLKGITEEHIGVVSWHSTASLTWRHPFVVDGHYSSFRSLCSLHRLYTTIISDQHAVNTDSPARLASPRIGKPDLAAHTSTDRTGGHTLTTQQPAIPPRHPCPTTMASRPGPRYPVQIRSRTL